MSFAVLAAEWENAARRRRVAVLSTVVPLLLVGAVALGGAPAPHATLVFTVLFTFFGTFGAAVPWARDAERGWLRRLALAGIPLPSLAAQRLVAWAAVDLIELAPTLLLLVVVYGADAGDAARLLVAVAAGLLAANALGLLVAAVARSLAETALLASVAALLLLHAAGVFRVPAPGSPAAALARAVPFAYMHGAIGAVVRD